MTAFVTPNGKEVQVVRDPKTAMFKVQFATGGELPQALSGIFTTERFANVAVTDYINSLPKKKEEDKEVVVEKAVKKTTKED